MAKRKRIGVSTGGGDCPGLNAVIRAVVKVALERDAEVVGIEYGFRGLAEEGFTRPLDAAAVRGILDRGGTVLGTTNRGDPFSYPMPDGSTRDLSDAAVAKAAALGLDCVVAVGGDGTLGIARKLADKGLPVVGVPKTIDGDVNGTFTTVGFDTARAICTEAIDRLHTTAEAHDRVMVLEVMGRESGFLALHSAMAGGADVALIPEVPYRIEPVIAEIEQNERWHRNFSVVVVAEGAKPAGGEEAVRAARIAGRSEPVLGGAGQRVAEALAARIPHEVRYNALGHMQRGGAPTAADRLLATRFGSLAAELALDGARGRVVVLRGGEVSDAPIAEAAGRRRLDPESGLVRSARALGISFGDGDRA